MSRGPSEICSFAVDHTSRSSLPSELAMKRHSGTEPKGDVMKSTTRTRRLVAATLFGAMAVAAVSAAHAQTNLNTAIGALNYENGYPTKETSQKLYDEMDLQRASQAYMWSVPAVNFASICHPSSR